MELTKLSATGLLNLVKYHTEPSGILSANDIMAARVRVMELVVSFCNRCPKYPVRTTSKSREHLLFGTAKLGSEGTSISGHYIHQIEGIYRHVIGTEHGGITIIHRDGIVVGVNMMIDPII